MLIRCWGSRGSIPVSGPEYIRYGGATTCMEIRSGNDDVIIVDAGSGIRRLGGKLVNDGTSKASILFTHAHWDHILGFPFFKLIYNKSAMLDIYGCPSEHVDMQNTLSQLMSPPYFPVPLNGINASVRWHSPCKAGEKLDVYGVTVESIPLSHPNNGLAYKFTENNRVFVFITDNELDYPHPGGCSFEEYVAFCKGADLLVHDAEFTAEEYEHTRGWGHSTWMRALDLAMAAQVKQYGLFHHNQERSDDAIDSIVEQCRTRLKNAGVDMHCFGMRQGSEIYLD